MLRHRLLYESRSFGLALRFSRHSFVMFGQLLSAQLRNSLLEGIKVVVLIDVLYLVRLHVLLFLIYKISKV